MQPQNRVTVQICNEEYVVRGNARPEYIERLARQVDERIRALAERHPRASVGRLAVLAALNLADELGRLSEQHERVVGMLEKEWQRRGVAPGRAAGASSTAAAAGSATRRTGIPSGTGAATESPDAASPGGTGSPA